MNNIKRERNINKMAQHPPSLFTQVKMLLENEKFINSTALLTSCIFLMKVIKK